MKKSIRFALTVAVWLWCITSVCAVFADFECRTAGEFFTAKIWAMASAFASGMSIWVLNKKNVLINEKDLKL